MPRPLVVVTHGTANVQGLAVLEQIAVAAARLVGTAPHLAFVDVVEPTAAEVVAHLPGAVVVPLFLASGYHVQVDVPDAADGGTGVTVTPALGSDGPVLDALAQRLAEADPHSEADALVLVAAGSSRAEARAEIAVAANALGARLGLSAFPAFLSGPGPTFIEAVAAARATGGARVVAVSHLLAPGVFQSKLQRQAAEGGLASTAPLGAHPSIVAAVAARYRAACAGDLPATVAGDLPATVG